MALTAWPQSCRPALARPTTAYLPIAAADRLAIRELVDAYAHCADRREAEAQKALFTEDTHFLVYMNRAGTEPTEDLHCREQLTPVFAALNQYQSTIHFNGQSTARIDGAAGHR